MPDLSANLSYILSQNYEAVLLPVAGSGRIPSGLNYHIKLFCLYVLIFIMPDAPSELKKIEKCFRLRCPAPFHAGIILIPIYVFNISQGYGFLRAYGDAMTALDTSFRTHPCLSFIHIYGVAQAVSLALPAAYALIPVY